MKRKTFLPTFAPGFGGSRPWSWGLAAVVLLGCLARLAVLSRGSGASDDPDNYLPLARALAEGRGFVFNGRPTAFRPPLYPLVLAPLVALCGAHLASSIAVLHVLLGAGTVVLTAATARRWGLSHRRALIAAVLVACDPVLVAQVRAVMTETLGAFLVALTLWGLARPGARGALLGGVGFGLSALCRPSLLPGAGLAALAIVLARRDPDDSRGEGGGDRPGTDRAEAARRPPAQGERGIPIPWRSAWRHGLVLIAATVATLAPWAWRNAWLFGEPVWTTTHGGYTLALANNPVYYDEVLNGPPGAVWSGPSQLRWIDSVNAAVGGLPEPEADRRLRAQALRWATALWTLPLGIALVLGLGRRRLWRWPRISAPLVVMALSCVHAAYWTDLRMRAPIVPALALIAASAGMPPALRENSADKGQSEGGK